jgi:hypothetical protein
MNYTADITFRVYGIAADDVQGVHDQLNNLIDILGDVDTPLIWDEVDWIIQEEDN